MDVRHHGTKKPLRASKQRIPVPLDPETAVTTRSAVLADKLVHALSELDPLPGIRALAVVLGVRLYKCKELLLGKRAVPRQKLKERLEISEATFKRDLAKLHDQLHVPIEFDRDQGGYVMRQGQTDTELPGLWFRPKEVLALVTIQQLLVQLKPGLLGPKHKPLQGRLGELLEKHGLAGKDITKRIHNVHAGKRAPAIKSFEEVAAATMARKRIRIAHYSRQNGKTTDSEVSPQRLVHYRDNWYVDAWCHLRDDRNFSIDSISRFGILEMSAKEVSA